MENIFDTYTSAGLSLSPTHTYQVKSDNPSPVVSPTATLCRWCSRRSDIAPEMEMCKLAACLCPLDFAQIPETGPKMLKHLNMLGLLTCGPESGSTT